MTAEARLVLQQDLIDQQNARIAALEAKKVG
jgi:hypothetical protein